MNFGRLPSLLLPPALLFFALQCPVRAQENQDNQAHIKPRVNPNQSSRQRQDQQGEKTPAKSQQETAPPAAQQEQGESSSRDSQIDLNASPLKDAGGTRTPEDADAYPFDPHRAAKDVEVGNYYLKQKNYRAALDRFHDALLYKPDDAEATFGLAVTQERMELQEQAYKAYSKYLEILPEGPRAPLAREAMKRIDPRLDMKTMGGSDAARRAERAMEQGESFLAQNDYEAARLRFEDALRLAPEDPEVYFRMGQSLQGMQRLDPARTYYRKYLEMQPAGPFATDAKRSIEQINGVLGK
jgi:Flp pilus assembly protein TadD